MSNFYLRPQERHLHKIRRHWITLVAQLAPYIVFAVFPLFLLELFPSNDLAFFGPWIQLLLGIYWLFIWSCVLTIFTLHYLTYWTITSHRIIHTHQRGLLSRHHWSVPLHEIERYNISRSTTPLSALFGLGTLTLTVSGHSEPLEMDEVGLHLLDSIHERFSRLSHN